jgi:radical SAM superfamily enzyme YgiQ (UPF0313 family)
MPNNRNVDVLFIHPGNLRSTYQALSNEFTAIAPPVWVGLLSENIRRAGYEAAVYDSNIEGWAPENVKASLNQLNPELIVLMVYGHNPSASTQTMPAALKVAADLSEWCPDTPVAMGGLHPTALPKRTLAEADVAFIIKGEGALAIDGLLGYLKGKRSFDSVPGVCRLDEKGNFVDTAMPALSNNLDDLYPGYAWDLLPSLSRYRAHNSHTMQYFAHSSDPNFADVRSPYAVIYTSLGCPYKCSFCCINALFGRSGIRYWSIETVMGWIDELVNQYKVKHIRIDDELFFLNEKRVGQFCDHLIERKYDLNLWAYARVDTIRPTMLSKMKQAGFNWLCLGIESALKDNRNNVNKVIRSDVLGTIRDIQASGINVLGNFMFGLPDDDHNAMQATLDLAIKSQCEFVNFYSTMAYPGSSLFDTFIKSEPKVLPDTWEAFSQHSFDSLPLPTKYLSPKEVLAFRDRAFDTYFSHPEYLVLINRKFGTRTLEHIEKMLAVKLKRKLLNN